jgi:hypothetical protein
MASPCAPRHGTALRPPDPPESVSADPADGVRPGRPSSTTLFRLRGPHCRASTQTTWPAAFGFLQCSLRLRDRESNLVPRTRGLP